MTVVGRLPAGGPLAACARVTLRPFVEHLNSIGCFPLKQPVTEDKWNNFKLITIISSTFMHLNKLEEKNLPALTSTF